MTSRQQPPDNGQTPTQAEQIWCEFQTALDALQPDVRAAFLLHDFFGLEHDDIALLIGQSPDACRQHVHLARQTALARLPLRDEPERLPPP